MKGALSAQGPGRKPDWAAGKLSANTNTKEKEGNYSALPVTHKFIRK